MNDGEQKKRKRAVQIIVRVTQEEKAEILKNMESVGISNLSVYARKMMLDGQVIHADFTEIKELSRQLGYETCISRTLKICSEIMQRLKMKFSHI